MNSCMHHDAYMHTRIHACTQCHTQRKIKYREKQQSKREVFPVYMHVRLFRRILLTLSYVTEMLQVFHKHSLTPFVL